MKKLVPMPRGIAITPSSQSVLNERIIPLSNSVIASNDLPSELRVDQIVCGSIIILLHVLTILLASNTSGY